MVEFMDIPPHRVVKLLQIGAEETVLSGNTIWMCVSCMRCVDRCPRNVAPGVIFEALRLITLRQGIDRLKYEEVPNIEEVPTVIIVSASRKLTG
jgi:heterodisulfide reductase subunit C